MNTTMLCVAVLILASCGHPAQAQTNHPPVLRPSRPHFDRMPGPGSFGSLTQWDNGRRIDICLSTFDLATNFVIAGVETGKDPPSQIAVVVKQLSSAKPTASNALVARGPDGRIDPHKMLEAMKARTAEEEVDWQEVKWMPFKSTVPIDLGPGDGKRMIWIAGKWEGQFQRASGTYVRVDHAPPVIVITNPVNRVTSQPMIQLQGYSDEPLQSIRYDAINASKRVENEQGFVNHQVVDLSAVGHFTTNFFTCYDIDLAPGTNTIILRCQDHAGNVATNTLTYVFALEHDKTPPVISLDRPFSGHELSGDTFTARGRVDDPTAQMIGSVVANGQTNTVEGLVERNGYFWVEHIPLLPGTNDLTLTTTDAAGNSSSTNVVVRKSDTEFILNIDEVPPARLWDPTLTVTGSVSPADHDVWVNGAQAAVQPDGRWIATNVPVVSPNGGTAVFEATAIPKSQYAGNKPVPAQKPNVMVRVQSELNTNAMTLNATQPACGAFSLRLTGTAGRSFILLASTNLADWTPILTNFNSGTSFDYTDTDVAAYSCRFFRVIEVP